MIRPALVALALLPGLAWAQSAEYSGSCRFKVKNGGAAVEISEPCNVSAGADPTGRHLVYVITAPGPRITLTVRAWLGSGMQTVDHVPARKQPAWDGTVHLITAEAQEVRFPAPPPGLKF
ncbi:MAG: hypothetical protein KBC73_05460 [Burkholderiaceae bacterium]|nr:hypothetical protein [Burkholderiaceae bacterium]